MMVDWIKFHNAAQLIAAISELAGGIIRLDEVYVEDGAGYTLGEVALEPQVLSDGSTVHNLVIRNSQKGKS